MGGNEKKKNNMNSIWKKILNVFFAFLCVSISLYPLKYFIGDPLTGLLSSKSPELLADNLWNTAFYGHITFGGLALLIGWTQFQSKWRLKYLSYHRFVGKVYVLSALISGACGIYIGFFASGGIISSMGFISLGLVWLYTTARAYTAIKKGRIREHQNWMIYSYAACFAAVSLRILLPLLIIGMGDFIPAYRIVAWMCWVPNLIVAHLIVRRNLETKISIG